MRRNLKACWALFCLRAAESLQYRVASLASASIGLFWAIIEIAVLVVFYTHGNMAQENVNGLSLPLAVTYIWLAQIIVPLTPMGINGEIHSKITSGDIGIELCRPLDLYAHWFAKTAAGRLGGFWWRAAAILLVSLLIPGVYGLSAPASTLGLGLFLLSLFCAFLLSISYGMLVTALRLGITWGEGPTQLLMLLGGVLSGAYLPLPLWPDFLQKFLLWQPFAGYLDIPARLYTGVLPPEKALAGLLLQLSWAGAFVMAGRLILRHKLKTIIVQGG